jgi:hypothetical protein
LDRSKSAGVCLARLPRQRMLPRNKPRHLRRACAARC